MKHIFSLIMGCLLFSNCTKNNAQANNNTTPKAGLVWQKALTKNGIMIGYGNTIIYDNEIVFFTSDFSSKYLKFFDKKTGNEIASWNDWIAPSQRLKDINFLPYHYKNFVIINDIEGSYIIDKYTKKTIKKIPFLHGTESSISFIDDKYFFTAYPETATEGKGGNGSIYMINLINYEKVELINTNRIPTTQRCYIDDDEFYFTKDEKGNSLIHFTYDDLTTFNAQTNTGSKAYYTILNINTKERKDSFEPEYGGTIKYYKDKLFLNGDCIDTATKKMLWSVSTSGFGGFLFDESTGIIYASIQDIDPTKPLGFFLKAIDANTGNVLWQKNIGNHCTKPFVMNGVVYTTVNGLLAFDTNTGNDVFRVSAKSLNPNDMSDFDGHNVIGDGERIYVSSGMYAYCLQGK